MNIHPKLPDDRLSQTEVRQKLITENKIEHLYFYKNGKQIARFEGESNYVNPAESQLIRMKDCEVLHNHLEGSSFSFEDIAAIITYNAKQLIVYSKDYTYFVKRPELGWSFAFGIDNKGFITSDNETLALFEEAKSATDDMLFKALIRGEITHTQKELEENHYIWSIFFKSKNIHYERIKN